MNEEEVRIAKIVAENSIEYFDKVMQSFQLSAYEEMRKIITTEIPCSEKTILDPLYIIERTLDRLKATKLANLVKSKKAGYIEIDDILKPKTDRTC